jgi:hypothetical protein
MIHAATRGSKSLPCSAGLDMPHPSEQMMRTPGETAFLPQAHNELDFPANT